MSLLMTYVLNLTIVLSEKHPTVIIFLNNLKKKLTILNNICNISSWKFSYIKKLHSCKKKGNIHTLYHPIDLTLIVKNIEHTCYHRRDTI